MTTTAENRYNVVGTRPARHDGFDKVTGAARFGADLNLPNMLHGKILRSPHAHARILSIDTSKAEALPGVMAVATAKDFAIVQQRPNIDYENANQNPRIIAENILADRKVPLPGARRGRRGRHQSPRCGAGAGPDRSRIRGSAGGAGPARRAERGCAPAAR